MEKVEQPMLVLVDCDAQFVYVSPEVIDLGAPGKVSKLLEVLQSAADFRTMPFDLGPYVIKGRLYTRPGTIELELKSHHLEYTAHMLYLQGRSRGSCR